MMPCSTSGALKQRARPYFSCRWLVARKTPPKKPTSSPKQMTFSSSAMAISRALLIACSMFMLGISLPSLAVCIAVCLAGLDVRVQRACAPGVGLRVEPDMGLEPVELALQRRGHIGVDVGDQAVQGRRRALLGALHGLQHLPAQGLLERLLLVVIPPVAGDQPVLQALEGVLVAPRLLLLLRAVARGVI